MLGIVDLFPLHLPPNSHFSGKVVSYLKSSKVTEVYLIIKAPSKNDTVIINSESENKQSKHENYVTIYLRKHIFVFR